MFLTQVVYLLLATQGKISKIDLFKLSTKQLQVIHAFFQGSTYDFEHQYQLSFSSSEYNMSKAKTDTISLRNQNLDANSTYIFHKPNTSC